MAVGDVLQIDLNWTMQKNPNTYSYHYIVTVDPSTAEPVDDLLAVFSSAVMPNLANTFDDSAMLDCLVASVIEGEKVIPRVDLIGAAGGRAPGLALPGQCSMLVQILPDVGEPTPRRRGRDFISALQEADQLDGDWTQAAADLVLSIYNTELAATLVGAGGGNYEYGVYSFTQFKENNNPIYVSNGGSTPDPPTFGDDTFSEAGQFRALPQVRTQRRRQPEDPCQVYLSET